MAIQELTTETFESTITSNDIVLVDFWAEWCGPCKQFGPVYEKVSDHHQDVVFGKLDTDANQPLAQSLGITGIPTIMAFREGVLVFNQAGALKGPDLTEIVTKVKELDMEAVHAEVTKLQAENSSENSNA